MGYCWARAISFISLSFLQRHYFFPPKFNKILGSHAAIIVYDITRKESFEALRKWIEEIDKNGPENISKIFRNLRICKFITIQVKVVVGNKIDLIEQENVSFEEGENFCKVY